MGGLTWNNLMTLNLDEVVSNDVTDLYNALLEFEAENEDNPAKLKKLFKVTQTVLTVKGMEAEQVLDQLASEAAEEGRKAAQKNQEIENLKVEIQTLRKKNRDLEHLGGSSGMNWKDQNFRETIEELESQITNLHKDLKDAKLKLMEEKEVSEQYRLQSDEFERKVREMKIDNDQLREDLRDIQRQSDIQRETWLNKMNNEQQINEKIKNKNILLNDTLDENRKLLEYNAELDSQIEKLNEEIIDGKNEIDKTIQEYVKLKLLVDHNEVEIDKYVKENASLKLQIEDLLMKLKVKNTDEDELIMQVNERVEEWKTILSEKDERIKDLHSQMMKLNEELLMKNIDVDQTYELAKLLAEKDEGIAILVEKLREAGVEIENNANFIEDIRSKMSKIGVDETKQELEGKMGVLENKLEERNKFIEDLEMRTKTAESDAIAKDKQLNEIYKRMYLYEQGIYGLPEAVSEIKQLESKLNERDRMVEDLIQYVNRCESQLNDLYDEAEDLRERLGLDPMKPLSIKGTNHRRGLSIMKDKSLNRILQNEIERLEDERLELKKHIREMSQSTGQRAVAFGLSTEDMELVNSLIDGLKGMNNPHEKQKLMTSLMRKNDDALKVIHSDDEKNTKKMNILHEENTELKVKLLDLQMENKLFEKIIKEIKEQTSSGNIANSESLQKFLEIMDSRSIIGRNDKAIILKSQLDHLKGRSEELRKELKEAKFEASKSQDVVNKLNVKNMKLEMELNSFKDQRLKNIFVNNLKFPINANNSNAEVINCLNEQLLGALEELSMKKDLMSKCEENYEILKKKFSVAIHKQGLIYDEIKEIKKCNDLEMDKMKKDLQKKDDQIESDAIKIQEFERLLDNLSKDEDEIKQRIADTSRKICILRTNEQMLSRKFSIVWDSEARLRKENLKLKSDSMEMEKCVMEKIGYLQRAKDSAVFKLSMVQRLLEESVPSSDLDAANKQFSELTEKYRSLLEATNSLVEYKAVNDSSQDELKCLKQSNNNLMTELMLSKEKINTHELALQRFHIEEENKTNSNIEGLTCSEADDKLLARRMVTLEMKELNERQRADHAVQMYDQQKKQFRIAEDKIAEMEIKFAKMTQMNLEMQKNERELRDELANTVSKSVSDEYKKKMFDLETSEYALKQEINSLKEVSEVALMQVQSMEHQKMANDVEMTSLRQQLLDFQAQCDERTVIGKLHHDIVELELKVNLSEKKSEKLTRKCEQLEARSLRSEQKLDEKDDDKFRSQRESSKRIKHLKMIIKECRRRFAGSIPLMEQEKFTKLLLKLQEDKTKIGIELAKTEEERSKVDDKLLELETKNDAMKELIETLKDGKGAQKVIEWHNRMQDVRISGLKIKRENNKLKEKMTFMEGIMKKVDADIKFMEEDKIKLTQEFEESQIQWEHREVELERTIQLLEVHLKQFTAISVTSVDPCELDTNLPLKEQIKQSHDIIRDKETKLIETKSRNAILIKKIEDLETQLREVEGELLRRERVIAELRLQIPSLFDKKEEHFSPDLKENEKFTRVTKQVVQDLQARLDQKEETVLKYRKLLEQSQKDYNQSSERYEKEIKHLQEQLQSKHETNLAGVKKIINENLSKPDKQFTSQQIRQVVELEGLLAEQELVICTLQDFLSELKIEIQNWKLKCENVEKESTEQFEELKRQYYNEVKRLEQQNDDMKKYLDEVTFELKETKMKNSLLKQKQDEIQPNKTSTSSQLQHDNLRASKSTMSMFKRTIENLRHDLACRDQKIKTLSRALLDIRSDMGEQDGRMEANYKNSSDSKALNEKVEELNLKIKKSLEERKVLKERDAKLSEELEVVQDALYKTEGVLRRCQQERDKLSLEVEELKQKIDRMSTMAKQRPETEGFHKELDDLRRRNKSLVEEFERNKLQPEKPYEHDFIMKDKWEKKCEYLRNQLREKDIELMRVTNIASMLKSASYREKENQEVLNKNKMKYSMTKKEEPPPVFGQVQELKRKIKSLGDEVSLLKQDKISLIKDVEEVQSQNKMISNSLLQTERNKMTLTTTIIPKASDYKELLQKENLLKKQVIELSEKNLQLNFELEQATRDLPRLKERLEDQQKYIDILKSEKKQREMISRSIESLSSFGSQSSSIKKIGESGRSTKELEKVISVLKKAVDKKRVEIDDFKLKLRHSESTLGEKEGELEILKKEYERLNQKVATYENEIESLEKILLDKDAKIKELQEIITKQRKE